MINNLYIDKNTHFEKEISYNSINFSLYTYSAKIRKFYTQNSLLDVTFTTEINGIDNTKLKLKLTPANTSTLKAGKYLYDVVITNISTGNKMKIIEGLCFILDTIST